VARRTRVHEAGRAAGARTKGGWGGAARLSSTRLADGTEVVFATAGAGPPLLFIGGWLSHLELSWALPAERQMYEVLAQGRTLNQRFMPR
jgi:hypothetical protein